MKHLPSIDTCSIKTLLIRGHCHVWLPEGKWYAHQPMFFLPKEHRFSSQPVDKYHNYHAMKRGIGFVQWGQPLFLVPGTWDPLENEVPRSPNRLIIILCCIQIAFFGGYPIWIHLEQSQVNRPGLDIADWAWTFLVTRLQPMFRYLYMSNVLCWSFITDLTQIPKLERCATMGQRDNSHFFSETSRFILFAVGPNMKLKLFSTDTAISVAKQNHQELLAELSGPFLRPKEEWFRFSQRNSPWVFAHFVVCLPQGTK